MLLLVLLINKYMGVCYYINLYTNSKYVRFCKFYIAYSVASNRVVVALFISMPLSLFSTVLCRLQRSRSKQTVRLDQ